MGWQSAFLQSLSILCLSAVAIAILVSLTALGKVPPPSREDFNREWAGTMRFWGLLAGVLAGVFVGSTALDIVWVGENGWAVQRAQITDVRVEERGTQFVAVIRYDYAGGSGGPVVVDRGPIRGPLEDRYAVGSSLTVLVSEPDARYTVLDRGLAPGLLGQALGRSLWLRIVPYGFGLGLWFGILAMIAVLMWVLNNIGGRA